MVVLVGEVRGWQDGLPATSAMEALNTQDFGAEILPDRLASGLRSSPEGLTTIPEPSGI